MVQAKASIQIRGSFSMAKQLRWIHLVQVVFVVAACCSQLARCDPKPDFDWSELGLSLGAQKPSPTAYNGSNNLRIYVSPQRRMTKSYELDYTNSTQPQSETAYVIPSSSSYASQPRSQQLVVGPNGAQTAAYSALSASIASLKSRLNSRGVALGEPAQSNQANLYSTQQVAPSSYSQSLGSSDVQAQQQQHQPQQQQQQQQQPHQQLQLQQHHQQAQQTHQSQQLAGQTTYLSVSNGQEQVAGTNHSGDNKTIVLAIPAKINFLPDGRSTLKSSQQQQQHLTVIQSPQGDQQHYAGKQLGLLSSAPDGGILEQVDQVDASSHHQQQQHTQTGPQQYVIVNSAGQVQEAGGQSAHVVAPNGQTLTLSHSPSYHQAGNLYHAIQAAPAGEPQASYSAQPTTKYIPLSSLVASQQQPLHQVANYEALPNEQPGSPSLVSSTGQRYIACLDTCNSADPRWKRYSSARYRACCLSLSQQDYQYDSPAAAAVAAASGKSLGDSDMPYAYQHRKSRGRRSRRLHKASRAYSGRYPSGVSGLQQDDESGQVTRQIYHSDSSYLKAYHKNGRPQSGPAALAGSQELLAGEKYLVAHPKAYRRAKASRVEQPEALLDAHGASDSASLEDEGSYPDSVREPSLSGYSSSNSYVQTDARNLGGQSEAEADELPGRGYDDTIEPAEPSGKPADSGSTEDSDSLITDTPSEDGGEQYDSASSLSLGAGAGHRYAGYQNARRRKQQPLKASLRKAAKELGIKKRNRNNKANNKYSGKQEKYSSQAKNNNNNGTTDYESTQPGDSYQYEGANLGATGASSNINGDDSTSDQQSLSGSYNQKEGQIEARDSIRSGLDKDSGPSSLPLMKAYNSQKQPSLNDSAAVASLSKTTMHLKEILSILDKKANASNESVASYNNNNNGVQQGISSTPTPITTTAASGNSMYPYSLLNSHFGSSQLSGLAADYLSSAEIASLKSPYRFETPSLQSSLASSSYSLPPSAYSSLSSSMADAYSTLGGYSAQSQYPILGPSKVLPSIHHPRKRRVNKSPIRYNGNGNPYVLPPPSSANHNGHSLSTSSALLHAAAKHPLVKQGLYSSLNYPYWYRNSSPAITNAYPYKNLNKNLYSPFLNGPVSSKIISSLYSDDARYSGLSSFDPLGAVASSLRPSTSLRLRSKPFVFQPQVLPIYTRHSILTQPLDNKK